VTETERKTLQLRGEAFKLKEQIRSGRYSQNDFGPMCELIYLHEREAEELEKDISNPS
jgi:hypothetical protein